MLASTVKFSKYNRHPAPDTAKLRHRQGPRPEETSRHTHPRAVETTRAGTCRPILQDPTTCQAPTRTTPRSTAEHPPRGAAAACTSAMTRPAPNNRCSTLEHPLPHTRGQTGLCTDQETLTGEMLLRKEVIQPHLPVRLPCYDLVPIASPTFDGSPHEGWATGFGCYRLS
jgi:hypothetical protein